MLELDKLEQEVKADFDKTCEIRRALHQIPEAGMEEFQTTQLIEEQLQKLNISSTRLDPTGLIAYIGPEHAYTIALRADIDGLRVCEDTDLPYKSKREGYMHACGHDGHAAGLLAAAKILKSHEEELSVRVKLIFEPSEENTLGAKCVIAQNVLDDVDEIFGLHLFSDIETGVISVESGPRMAQTDRFSILFKGKGGHAGKPHQCVDATVMMAEFILSCQTIVSRNVDPVDSAVVTIGKAESGTQYNVISGDAHVEGTCRSFSEDVANHLRRSIQLRAEHIADYYGGSAEISYDFGSHPPVINDVSMSDRIFKEANVVLGPGMLRSVPKLMLGDDFSWYQTKVPGVYAFVGCGNREKGIIYPNHHSKFMIDEKSLEYAVMLHLCAVHAAESCNATKSAVLCSDTLDIK